MIIISKFNSKKIYSSQSKINWNKVNYYSIIEHMNASFGWYIIILYQIGLFSLYLLSFSYQNHFKFSLNYVSFSLQTNEELSRKHICTITEKLSKVSWWKFPYILHKHTLISYKSFIKISVTLLCLTYITLGANYDETRCKY